MPLLSTNTDTDYSWLLEIYFLDQSYLAEIENWVSQPLVARVWICKEDQIPVPEYNEIHVNNIICRTLKEK